MSHPNRRGSQHYDEYEVTEDNLYASFPTKEEYGYASVPQQAVAGQSPAQAWADNRRAEASAAIRRELASISFYQSEKRADGQAGYGRIRQPSAGNTRLTHFSGEEGRQVFGGTLRGRRGKTLIPAWGRHTTSKAAITPFLGQQHDENIYAAFPTKEEYGYDSSEKSRTTAGQSPAQAWADNRRAQASASIQREIARRTAGRYPQDNLRILPEPQPGDRRLAHFSGQEALQELDPSFHGTGIAGAESVSKKQDPANWVDRTYYALNVGKSGGYVKERGLGAHVYFTDVPTNSLYDIDADSEGFRAKAREEQKQTPGSNETNIFERMIRDAGYLGYFTNYYQAAAVFEKLAVKPMEFRQSAISQTETPAFKKWFGNSKVVDAKN